MNIGFIGNIETLTLKNTNFRKVLFTGKHCQLVVMSLKPLEDIGLEVHKHVDQFFRIEKGHGVVVMNDKKYKFKNGFSFVIPAGMKHNVINTSKTVPLKLYTVYSPPQHKPLTVNKTKPLHD